MRIAAWLVVALFSTATLAGQAAIEWSSARKLSRDDFKGRAPMSGPAESMSWINIDASWECESGELVAHARATFNPALSWWRLGRGSVWGNASDPRTSASRAQLNARTSVLQRDAQLLDHEQLHFDIAEVAARKIRARFEEFRNACAEPGLTEPIAQIITEIDRELQEEQVRYDRETAHGANAGAQDSWRRRIRQRLADLPERSPATAVPHQR